MQTKLKSHPHICKQFVSSKAFWQFLNALREHALRWALTFNLSENLNHSAGRNYSGQTNLNKNAINELTKRDDSRDGPGANAIYNRHC